MDMELLGKLTLEQLGKLTLEQLGKLKQVFQLSPVIVTAVKPNGSNLHLSSFGVCGFLLLVMLKMEF